MSKGVSPYVGLTFGLLTQHEKEHVLDPILRAGLGARVVRVEGFDTDLLGTFTGERARVGTQREAARAKAERAVALSGLPVGLGSEGPFTTDPMTGLLPLDVEVVLAWDVRDGVELVGRASGMGLRSGEAPCGWCSRRRSRLGSGVLGCRRSRGPSRMGMRGPPRGSTQRSSDGLRVSAPRRGSVRRPRQGLAAVQTALARRGGVLP